QPGDVHSLSLGEGLDAALKLGRAGPGPRAEVVLARGVELSRGAAHGALLGELERLLRAGAGLGERLLDVGNDLAALDDHDAVADADVLLLHLGGVVKRRPLHRGPG